MGWATVGTAGTTDQVSIRAGVTYHVDERVSGKRIEEGKREGEARVAEGIRVGAEAEFGVWPVETATKKLGFCRPLRAFFFALSRCFSFPFIESRIRCADLLGICAPNRTGDGRECLSFAPTGARSVTLMLALSSLPYFAPAWSEPGKTSPKHLVAFRLFLAPKLCDVSKRQACTFHRLQSLSIDFRFPWPWVPLPSFTENFFGPRVGQRACALVPIFQVTLF